MKEGWTLPGASLLIKTQGVENLAPFHYRQTEQHLAVNPDHNLKEYL